MNFHLTSLKTAARSSSTGSNAQVHAIPVVETHPAISAYFDDVKSTLDRMDRAPIDAAVALLHQARLDGRQVFVMGNGGSASTASHMVCDLAKNTRHSDRPHLKVIGLTDNMALFSAYSNDEGYGNVFARQLASLIQDDDIVIAISTSGRSENVIRAIEVAQQHHARIIAMTGFDSGVIGNLVDVNIHVPSESVEQIEDIHLIVEHLIAKMLRDRELMEG